MLSIGKDYIFFSRQWKEREDVGWAGLSGAFFTKSFELAGGLCTGGLKVNVLPRKLRRDGTKF